MTKLLSILFAIAMVGTLSASAQTTLQATPSQQQSLFCDLCKIQGCDCTGTQCINCTPGRLTSNTGGEDTQQQLNLKTTRNVCTEAKGRMSRGQCRLN